MIFYHPGTAGEVSHEAARAYIADILANPFTDGYLLWRLSDAPWMRHRARLCAPGAMNSYLQHAALRELTREP